MTGMRMATAAANYLPVLTVVVPTYQERDNIRRVVAHLDEALAGIAWEVVFADDDSPDGTADEVRTVAAADHRVRLLHRLGRRGLSSACIEGILSSTAPIAAVMDADLQHDERLLPAMYRALEADDGLDLVIGSRHVSGGSVGDGLSEIRRRGSDLAGALTRRLLRIGVTDPMSGFFMVRRRAFNEVALELQSDGFKILADMLSASGGRWKVLEMPYAFRARAFGISKMDAMVTLDLLGLLVSRLTNGMIPIRFALFSIVGLLGVAVQLAAVRLSMLALGGHFLVAQGLGILTAMTSNFVLNNRVTYREKRLKGRAFLRGLLSFYVVCSFGALTNFAVAKALYAQVPLWMFASVIGALAGAFWNFWLSLFFTWRAR